MPSKPSPIFLLPLLLLLPLSGCTTLMVTTTAAGVAVAASERRSVGTFLDDQIIEISVTDRIYGDPLLGKQVHLKVTSYDRVVLLTGEVPNDGLRQRALGIVREARAVRAVLDETRIAPPPPFSQRLRDRWTALKIKLGLLGHGRNPLRTQVIVSAGTAYLLGELSDEEADAAVAVARQTRGVRRVVLNNNVRTPAPALAGGAPPPTEPVPPEEPPPEPAEAIPYSDAAAFETPHPPPAVAEENAP